MDSVRNPWNLFTVFACVFGGAVLIVPEQYIHFVGWTAIVLGSAMGVYHFFERSIKWAKIKKYIKSAENFARKRIQEIDKERSTRLTHIMEFNGFGFMFSNGLAVSKAFKEPLINERILSIFVLMFKIASNEIQGNNARDEREVTKESYQKAASFLETSIFETLTKEISLDEFDASGFKDYKNFESLVKAEKEEKFEIQEQKI